MSSERAIPDDADEDSKKKSDGRAQRRSLDVAGIRVRRQESA
jgi:hypothetical protein